ncbi:F-box domain, Leucine-rich repeat domain, L domain-like protein [Artemisia annua]|uniref:F-box domain, Leucine-rich repeat domain, L domain-like protein n=1 Tax=Artemisia annua TaxID=35608 RepID=A0A2U1KRH9_ARTAN|nr:F-box domain, Leucine-rich repeat domain, L domain-like protein [Artemisia annua]
MAGDIIMDNNYTLRDLQAIAKQRKIKGYTKYRKLELAKLLGIIVIEGKGKRTRGETQIPPKILPLPEVTRTSTSKSKKQDGMKQTTRNWLDLPSDLMANILSRVGVIEILWNVKVVCTKWHEVCKDPYVWRVIYIDRGFYENYRPYTWPSCLPISARSSKATVEICKQAVDRSQGELVDITLVQFIDDGILQYIADRSSKLRRLEIALSDIRGLATAFKKLPLLEELSLYQGTLLQEDIE